MKVRVTYVVDKGNHIGLVQQAIQGEVIECDRITFDHGVLCLWKRVGVFTQEAVEDGIAQQFADELVKAYGPGTYRTVIPLVGASDQPTETTDENTPGRAKERRSVRAP